MVSLSRRDASLEAIPGRNKGEDALAGHGREASNKLRKILKHCICFAIAPTLHLLRSIVRQYHRLAVLFRILVIGAGPGVLIGRGGRIGVVKGQHAFSLKITDAGAFVDAGAALQRARDDAQQRIAQQRKIFAEILGDHHRRWYQIDTASLGVARSNTLFAAARTVTASSSRR